jgi:hypothetical protein
MAKDFNNFGHKNAELLRHYIVREMKKINKKLSSDSNQIIGCFVASFVDVLIVMIFDDVLEGYTICKRFICLAILIIIFIIVSKIIIDVLERRKINYILLNKEKYNRDEIEKYIDEFDNTACDGLLICQYYKKKYRENQNEIQGMQEFYFYEMVHHLNKSVKIFDKIYSNDDLYVRKEIIDDDFKIDNYRIDNFKKISKEIYNFLEKEMKKNNNYKDNVLKNDMENIKIILKESKK